MNTPVLKFLDEKLPNTFSMSIADPVDFERLYEELKTLKTLGYWVRFCGKVLIFRSTKITPNTRDLIRDLLENLALSIEFIESPKG